MDAGTRPVAAAAQRRRLSAEERRERILEAATAVFADRGYAAASMGEIAQRAGVVASVIYDHFGSKRELHIELLRLHGDELIRRSITEVRADTPRGLLESSVEAFYRLVEEDPFVWRFLFRDPPSDPEITAAWRDIQDRATAGITAMILTFIPAEARLPGMSRERAAEMLAKASQEATQGLAEWWYEHPEISREQMVETIVSLLWSGLEGLLAGALADAADDAS